MDPTTDLLVALAKAFRISPVASAVWIPLIIIFANRAAKLIPDNATGWLGYVRIACSILGLKVNNNTGVPPVLDVEGNAIPRVDPETVSEPVAGLLKAEIVPPTDETQTGVRRVFQLGAAAIKDFVEQGK